MRIFRVERERERIGRLCDSIPKMLRRQKGYEEKSKNYLQNPDRWWGSMRELKITSGGSIITDGQSKFTISQNVKSSVYCSHRQWREIKLGNI